MSISVIIPTRNRVSFLVQTIQSILNQTSPVDEIIIMDDNSNDNTKEVILSLVSTKIKYFNFGSINNIGKLRNIGISKAKGKFIAFCDDDDLWIAEKAEKQLNFLRDYDFVCSNASIIDKNSIETKKYYHDFKNDFVISLEKLLVSNFILTSSVIVRKDIFNAGFSFSEVKYKNLCEDYFLWLQIAGNYKMYYINQPLELFRAHASITNYGDNRLKIWGNHINIIEEYANNGKNISKAAYLGILNSKVEILKIHFHNKNYNSFLTEIWKLLKLSINKWFLLAFITKTFKKILKFPFG